jgi:glucose/arabinose dehydrogenase
MGRIFASGLRNPNGLSFEAQSKAFWAVMERDEISGPDLVPDYLTSVKDGGLYGWPYSYHGQGPAPASGLGEGPGRKPGWVGW